MIRAMRSIVMKRPLVLLLFALALGTVSTSARASMTRLATASAGGGALAGSGSGGDYAFALTATTMRYGNATTGRSATVTLPDPGCRPVSASGHTVLVTCAPRRGVLTHVPLLLDTHSGQVTTTPGARYEPSASYTQIGRTWIFGQIDRGATFINRFTGQLIPAAPDGIYDLDTTGTPSRLPSSRIRGARILSRSHDGLGVQYTATGHLELVLGSTVMKVLSACHTDCGDNGVAGHTAAWTEGNRVLRYSTLTHKTTVTTFNGNPQIVVQPHQVLVAVLPTHGHVGLFRLR